LVHIPENPQNLHILVEYFISLTMLCYNDIEGEEGGGGGGDDD
jgi:hypothetical protein